MILVYDNNFEVVGNVYSDNPSSISLLDLPTELNQYKIADTDVAGKVKTAIENGGSVSLIVVDGEITGVNIVGGILPPQPTADEYLLDLDFRLSMLELGL